MSDSEWRSPGARGDGRSAGWVHCRPGPRRRCVRRPDHDVGAVDGKRVVIMPQCDTDCTAHDFDVLTTMAESVPFTSDD